MVQDPRGGPRWKGSAGWLMGRSAGRGSCQQWSPPIYAAPAGEARRTGALGLGVDAVVAALALLGQAPL